MSKSPWKGLSSYIYRTGHTIVYVKFSHRRSWFRHVETLKDTQDSGKGESLFRHFVSFLVIGIYSDINNITGFSPYLEIESFGLP